MKKYIATIYAYKSQAEFQANKDNWVLAGNVAEGELEDFESLENVKYDKFIGFYLESKDLQSLRDKFESKAIEFKNNPEAAGAKFIKVYVYVDDSCILNKVADISYDFSEK